MERSGKEGGGRDRALAALERLKRGNRAFLAARANPADVSPEVRARTAAEGQRPCAVVIGCADSRTPPEHAFTAGVGELFCVRTAGNVVGPTQLGSVVYAAKSLGTRLVVVMGHTGCGAVKAARSGGCDGAVSAFTDLIAPAVAGARDDREACEANVRAGLRALEACGELRALEQDGLTMVGAVYDTATGAVEFLDEGEAGAARA